MPLRAMLGRAPVAWWNDDLAEPGPVLDRHGMRVCGGWFSGLLLDGDIAAEKDRVRAQLDLFRAMKAPCIVYGETAGTIQGSRAAPDAPAPRRGRDRERRPQKDIRGSAVDGLGPDAGQRPRRDRERRLHGAGRRLARRRRHGRGAPRARKPGLVRRRGRAGPGRPSAPPHEVARAIPWMASDESGMMTGAVVPFDQSVYGGGGDAPTPAAKLEA